MNRFDLSDDELKNFIKQYAPKAPVAPEGELEKIVIQIENDEYRRHTRFNWLVGSGTIAASFAAFMLFYSPVNQNMVATNTQPAIEWEDEATALLGKELPTNNVGEMYFSLIAMNGNEK
jgi:hypothetical protein